MAARAVAIFMAAWMDAMKPELVLREKAGGASAREMGWAVVVMVAALAAIVGISGGGFLLVRGFWLDEICTWLLVNDPQLSHAMRSLLQGVDSNPPALYLMLRGVGAMGIPQNEVGMRLFSAGAVVAGLVGTYGMLRTVFDRVSSATAICVIMAAGLLQFNVFEARFYAPWFATSVWFCRGLLMMRGGRRVTGGILVGVLGPLMLTIHYFGAFTFGLIVAADFLADSGPVGARVRARWPLLTAVPAMGLVAYFYVHQSAAFTMRTWVDSPTWWNSYVFLRETLNLRVMVALAIGVAGLWGMRKWVPVFAGRGAVSIRPVAGLLSLALLPVVVLGFSVLVQPASVPRYALPGLGGVAVIAAVLVSRLRREVAGAVACVCVVLTGVGYHSLAREMAGQEKQRDAYRDHLAAMGGSEKILCEWRFDLYPLVMYAPEMRERLYLLDFEAAEKGENFNPTKAFAVVERDANRAVTAAYPFFQRESREELAGRGAFLFVAADGDGARVSRRFAGSQVRWLGGRLFEVSGGEKVAGAGD